MAGNFGTILSCIGVGRGIEVYHYVINQLSFGGEKVAIEPFLCPCISERFAQTVSEHPLQYSKCFFATDTDDSDGSSCRRS
jgi:hypothetical protein